MKKLSFPVIITVYMMCILLTGCKKDFLEKKPQGAISEITLANRQGVNGLLIGAYSMLDGIGEPGVGNPFGAQAISNWIFGGTASDDAHKGGTAGNGIEIAEVTNFTANSSNRLFPLKWVAVYSGAQRANDVLRLLPKVPGGAITEAERKQLSAEAVFLRAVFHLEAAKMWKNVPYVDETISFDAGNYNVPNTEPIWPKLEKDFQFAIDNLSETNADPGRPNNWAAKSFLAKVYMFQHKFTEAKPLLEDIIQNGVNYGGQHYGLVNFSDNFNAIRKNGIESIFAVQMSVKDGSSGYNGNGGEIRAHPAGGISTCCGFYAPSFSLVNSYKTDPVTGLPLLDTWNNEDVKNDQGLGPTDAFTPYTGTLDPRLDWTVGRRGLPYLDHGITPGQPWIFDQGLSGPNITIKNSFWKADEDKTSDFFNGWGRSTANNYNMIRFADVLLWAAEVEVEIGSLQQAEQYVNRVRDRMTNPSGWVHTYVDNSDPAKGFTNTPAANYKIGLYSGQFAANGQDYARKAVRFERKIELAMEGHRFFDLQRYDNGTGYMAEVMNAYISHEVASFGAPVLQGATFKKGKNEYYPIPLSEIDKSTVNGIPTLAQNTGY